MEKQQNPKTPDKFSVLLRKYSLVLFIAMGLFRLANQERDITFADVFWNIVITAMMYGILVWGYQNAERNRIDKKGS